MAAALLPEVDKDFRRPSLMHQKEKGKSCREKHSQIFFCHQFLDFLPDAFIFKNHASSHRHFLWRGSTPFRL